MLLVDTGKMSIDRKRSRIIIVKTKKGIKITLDSLWSNTPTKILYYRDGEYPLIPTEQDARKYQTTYIVYLQDRWLNILFEYFKPYRTFTHL